jgi:hypothetical protein
MHKLDPNAAIKSIFTDDQWLVKTGIGGMSYAGSLLLLMLNFFTLPLAIVLLACTQGYILRVIRSEVTTPNSKLPDWGDVVDLFVSGLTWIAISVLFVGITLLITCGLTLGFIWVTAAQNYACSSFVGSAVVVSAGMLYASMSFVLTFLMANLAVQETNTAGFEVITVLKKAWTNKADFLTTWLVGEGLKLFAFWLPLATVFGAFLLPSTIFIAQIVAAKLAAQVWSEKATAVVLSGQG